VKIRLLLFLLNTHFTNLNHSLFFIMSHDEPSSLFYLPLDRPRRSPSPSTKRPKGPYAGLCIGSGSTGGYQYLGILHYLDKETDWLKDLRVFAGTSVGACISGMMAIGYKPIEVMQYLCEHDLNHILTFDLLNIRDDWGMISTTDWKGYLTKLIISKWGSDPTLLELWDKSGHQVCFATWRLNHPHHKVYLTHQSYPSLRLSEAIAMSSCIPGVFSKCEYQKEYYIDGALFDACPTEQAETYLSSSERLLSLRFSVEHVPPIHSHVDYFKAIFKSYETIQEHKEPSNGDEIILKTDFLGLSLQVETEKKIDSFKNAYKRVKYQLFLPKFKRE
jgi:hypothetical protein